MSETDKNARGIFQSNFCRESFYDLGMQPRSWDIIHNGVPASVFFPNSTFKVDARKIKLIAMSWSKNTLKGFGTIAKLSMLDDVEVSFIGNWPSTINCEKVTLLGAKTEKEIALILRRFNGFIHAALNEPSSNAIIEALSSGLPILYKNSGGNRELAGEFGTELTDNLKISISNFREHIKEYRERILDNIHRFSIEYVADLYITAINHGLDSL